MCGKRPVEIHFDTLGVGLQFPTNPDKGDRKMRTWLILAAILFVPACSYAQGAKPCEELKSEIATKLDAKGVKSYSLEIVPKDQDVEGKVVGSCEGGTQKIVYRRTATAPQSPAKEAGKP
jgi:Protein of unknown function (DUF1161)